MSNNIHFISAGAGSGKTYTLTQKLEALLTDGSVSPAGIIATTFTKLAAGELKERVRSKLIEAGQLEVANLMEQSLIGTVNGVCGEILRRFAFEAGMPPDQRVLEESQGNILFFQALERALENNKTLIRQMNAVCHRLQITNQQKQLQWRSEVKSIVDAARANNQTAENIRGLGATSAEQLLEHFSKPTTQDLDSDLLGAINHAIANIDTETDSTKVTREYLMIISGIRAAILHERMTWPEWISLSKKMPGAKSKSFAEPIADIAINYEKHSRLHSDIRFFTEHVFKIAADSLDAYQQLKTQKGLIDFVDQEQRLYMLLDHPTVTATLGEELQLLMVDEFQDTSPIQLAVFLKLSRLAKQVIWVGDIKQSIYGFRGSDPALMSAVLTQVIADGNPPQILEQSWRSSPELVQYINNLFVPAFAYTLQAEQVALESARSPVTKEPAVEQWRLTGKNKSLRAKAMASGIRSLMESGRTVIDKDTEQARPLNYNDIGVLCRTHVNLSEIAVALAEANLPIRYNRAGLLATPEGSLTLACLRRLIDPADTLASAEIQSLTHCEAPESWLKQRLEFLAETDSKSHKWMEADENHPVAKLMAQRSRLPLLTPLETLRVAMEAGNVRETVYRWGPNAQRSQHRLNNLSALLGHARDYTEQCASRNEPATASGLVLWLYALADAEEDIQASGNDENAIQLVTHHGAKGLEWPMVVAMDLDAKLKPRIWGLSVLAAPGAIDIDNPLTGRTLRYWASFTGQQSSNIPLLERIEASETGQTALENEVAESKRLLYVSLTRPRDGLIITTNNTKESGPWMETLQAPWMLPAGDDLTLPDGNTIPSRALEFEAGELDTALPEYLPTWLETNSSEMEKLPLRLSPSSVAPLEAAQIGGVIELGDRLEITGEYEADVLGSALHAVIATSLLGQCAAERVLESHDMQNTISAECAKESFRRLTEVLEAKFAPNHYYIEYPIHYTTNDKQVMTGWIDLLLETEAGFVLIDHKASPRARTDWNEIALSYSGQLQAYAKGITKATGKPVLSCWIHFAVTGGMVEVVVD